MAQKKSPEYCTFRKNYEVLKNLQHEIGTISAKAFAAGIISKDLHIKCSNESFAETDRTEWLLNALEDKLLYVPATLRDFADILNDTVSFEYIGKLLLTSLERESEMRKEGESQPLNTRSQINYKKRQRVFQRVIAAKCVISVCVVIFNYLGIPRSGKTTLRRRITGEILNLLQAKLAGETEQPSTGVVEDGGQVFIKPSCVEMGTIKSRVWSAVKSLEDEVNMLNQLFHNTIHLPAVSTSDEESESKVLPEISTSDEGSSPIVESKEIFTSDEAAFTTPPLALKTNEIQQDEDMLTILKDIMETDHWDEVKDLLEDTILVSNNDTGGHAEFLDLQAALIQGPSFNLFFSRLHDNLDKVFEVYYTNERGESSTKEDSTMTTEEAMYQALANIACFGGAFSDQEHALSSECSGSKKKGSQSVNPSSKAMFVCTHLDKVNEEMRKSVFTEKDELLQKKIEKTEFYEKDMIVYASENQLMLPVDNLNGGEDEIKQIQAILMREIEKSFNNRIDIPASWLILSLYLRKNFSIVSIKKCEEIARKLGINLEELQDSLWFLHHRVGVILYYPEVEAMRDIVICKMQVVFDSASNLIRNTFTFNKVGQRLTNKFKQKGQFSLSDIKDATAQHKDLIPVEKLVKLFQHLNIIATIRPTLDSLSEPTYFMPCVLQSARASELNVSSSTVENPAPLLLRYDCGYVPAGIFPALITNLVSQQREDWELIEDGLCKNKVQFHIGDDYDMVTFISHPRHFEIVVTRPEEYEKSTELLCAYIRSIFISTLKKVTSSMNYHFRMGYQFAFECPAHPGKEHLCILPKENAVKMLCQENPRRQQPIALQQCHKVWFSEAPPCQVESSSTDAKGSQLSAYLSSLPDDALLYLDKLLDWDQEGVDKHLNEIAETMIDWEEKLSTRMALTEVQIHDLKKKHSSEPILLRRAVLKKWKEQQGLQATYRNLLKLCFEGGVSLTAKAICKVLREKALEEGGHEFSTAQKPTENPSSNVDFCSKQEETMSLPDEQSEKTEPLSDVRADSSDSDDEFLTPCGSFDEAITQPAALGDTATETRNTVDYPSKDCLILQEELIDLQKDLLKLQEKVQEKMRSEQRKLLEELSKLEAENKKLRRQLNSRNKRSEQQVLELKEELYQRNVEHSATLHYVLELEKTISQLKAERHL